MSKMEANDPVCTRHSATARIQIKAKSRDLGGFSVRRVLPSAMARRVGPFVFFDEMGPADFEPGAGINVRPHPHIGLATVTFLLEGEILHRDSLGFVQPIQPGAVNLMTAGRGIVHSERTDPALERDGQRLHGLQVWMALPEDRQEVDPDFVHYPKKSLPVIEPGRVHIEAGEQSQVMIIGGEDIGPREIYWNFVHTSRERIEMAKRDWREGNFAPVPGDDEFIPLPGD